MIKTLIISAALIAGTGAAQADIVAMGYDEEEKVLVALTDKPCEGFEGDIVAAMAEQNREAFVGCWVGEGNTIKLMFPIQGFTIEYKSSMFRVLNKDWQVTEGTIRSTV